MPQTDELALDWNANKIAILNRLEAGESRQEKTDAALAILPVLSNTVEEMHDRMVHQEVAHEKMAALVDALQTEVALLKERETMSNRGVVATAATGAGAGGILGNLDWIADLLKMGGG
jgi:hypothetical protein